MRGRQPSGPEFVDKLPGDAAAKARLRVVLETLTGACRVHEACQRLNLSEQRFDQVRIEALQGALAALEPKPIGRPPRASTLADEELAQLRARVAELEAQLRVAAVRTEVAGILPHTAAAAEKKRRNPAGAGRSGRSCDRQRTPRVQTSAYGRSARPPGPTH